MDKGVQLFPNDLNHLVREYQRRPAGRGWSENVKFSMFGLKHLLRNDQHFVLFVEHGQFLTIVISDGKFGALPGNLSGPAKIKIDIFQ